MQDARLFSSKPDPVALLGSLVKDLEDQERNLDTLLRRVRRDLREVRERLVLAVAELSDDSSVGPAPVGTGQRGTVR